MTISHRCYCRVGVERWLAIEMKARDLRFREQLTLLGACSFCRACSARFLSAYFAYEFGCQS